MEKQKICEPRLLTPQQELKRVKRLLKGSYPQKAAAEAEQLLSRLKQLPNESQVSLHVLYIETLVRSDQHAKALSQAKALTEQMPSKGAFWGKYAWAAGKSGHLSQAIELRKKQHEKSDAMVNSRMVASLQALVIMKKMNTLKPINTGTAVFNNPDGTWHKALRWYIPFTHLLNNNPNSAIQFWNQELDKVGKDRIKHRFFWGWHSNATIKELTLKHISLGSRKSTANVLRYARP